MVPKAPWIWPMWASSRTATRAAPGLTRMVMGRPPWPNPRRRGAALRLLWSYALAQRFEIAVWVLLGAPVETLVAISAGRLGPSFMVRGPSVCQRASQGGLRFARVPLHGPGAHEPAGRGIAPPAASEQPVSLT